MWGWVLVGLLAYGQSAGLTGRWALDKKASEDLDPFLEAQGVSAVERAIARRMAVVHVVEDHGETVLVRMESAVRNQESTYVLDGVPREQTTPEGTVTVAFRRTEEGAIHGEASGTTRDGAPYRLVSHRAVSPEGAMVLTLALTVEKEGTAPITVRRVFQRETDPAAPAAGVSP